MFTTNYYFHNSYFGSFESPFIILLSGLLMDPAAPQVAKSLSRGTFECPNLPTFFEGEVVKGFGRGSKELGCPTANIPIGPYTEVLANLPNGVYYGYSSFTDPNSPYSGITFPTALSIGWNPFYKNKEKTIEAHLIHKFTHDFYGEVIHVSVLGYIRPEWNFSSLGKLIK